MKKFIICALATFYAIASSAQKENVLAQMDAYLQAMDYMSISDAQQEADFMISCVPDSSLRNIVAEKAYKHFVDSKIMGSENVAIHIFDRWFATFETLFENIDDFDFAQFHAFVNRKSLIGAKGESITLTDTEGDDISIPFSDGRRSVIYFYSTSCPKCLYTSMKLRELFKEANPDVNFFAVYTGENDEDWAQYRTKELNIQSSNGSIYHFRGGNHDFVTAYSVTQTPRLFLLDENGIITGRNLDAEALSTLLDSDVHNFVENSCGE